jgi:hypothetical protein
MFTVEERDRVRAALLDLARTDPAVGGAAVTGSYAVDGSDRWSDIDLALAVDGPLEATLERWTALLYRDFAALHHWDLPSGPSLYRVYLLPGCLEVDLAFTPADRFGPLGPRWRTVFGHAVPPEPAPPARPDPPVGLAWHHVLHARACVERRRWWQAAHWISGIRDQVIALACLRLGHPSSYAKGAHLLPGEVTGPLAATLVRSLDEAELRRALAAVTAALHAEVARTDPVLADRLRPALAEAGGLGDGISAG